MEDTQATAPLEFQELGSPEQLAELYGALASARGEFTRIAKNRTVKIKSAKGDYTFDYAELEESLAATVPALSKHGLVVLQPAGGAILRTIVAHKSGARIITTMPLPAAEDIKTFGGSISYMRRYCYNATLCLSADADADDMPDAKRGESHAEARPRSTPQVPRQEQPRPLASGSNAPSTSAAQTPSQSPQPFVTASQPASAPQGSPGGSDEKCTPEQQAKIRGMLVATGAKDTEFHGIVADILAKRGEQRMTQGNFVYLTTELGKLAIANAEQANG